MRLLLPAACLALSCLLPAAAQEAPFKFTTGVYRLTGGGLPPEWALDLNLRYTGSWGNAWVGGFTQPHEHFSDARAGWDNTFDLGALRVQPSVQLASGGFRGGSLYAETGDDWYASAGLGRTNLRPYVNLNFDPNDAWALAAGRRWADHESLGLLLVGDNREHPDQRHLHLAWRKPQGDGDRLTVDLLAKQGLVEGTRIRRLGATVAYDWPRHFVRLAWDPKVNFTPQDMLRVSGGMRF